MNKRKGFQQLSVMVPEDVLVKLKKIAKKDHRPVSTMILMLIIKAVEE